MGKFDAFFREVKKRAEWNRMVMNKKLRMEMELLARKLKRIGKKGGTTPMFLKALSQSV